MKMEKPTAEAVRFDSADVIATSGGGVNPYANLTAGKNYATLASEAIEGGFIATADKNFYVFTYGGNDTFSSKNTAPSMPSSYIYTWFDNAQWWTDNDQTVRSLVEKSGNSLLPHKPSGWRIVN